MNSNTNRVSPGDGLPGFREIGVFNMPIGGLRLAAVGTSTLDDDDREALRVIADVFRDVLSDPIEKWETDFSRDANPKNEIRVWQRMAASFRRRTALGILSLEQKKELFGEVLLEANERTPVKVVLDTPKRRKGA